MHHEFVTANSHMEQYGDDLAWLRGARFGACQLVDWTAGRRSEIRQYPADLETLWIVHDELPDWLLGVQFTADAQTAGFTVVAPVDENPSAWPAPDTDGVLLTPSGRQRHLPRRIPRGGLTASTYRRIRWGEVEHAARQWLPKLRSREVTRASAAWGDEERPSLGGTDERSQRFTQAVDTYAAATDEPEPPRPGPIPRPDSELVIKARDYVQALADSDAAKAPVKHLAGRWICNVSTARGLIATCRQRGLLTDPPTPGKAGGSLTAYAEALLADADRSED